MGRDKGASVRQRRVSAELRALRQDRGLTCQEVADALDWSVSKVSRIENEATAMFNYEPLFVPGLLQTGDYARAVIAAGNLELAEGAVDQLVRTRMGRQALLSRLDAPMLNVMVDEMVLRRPIGDAGCMYGQLRHLESMTNRSRVEIRVVPFSVGANPGLEGPMVIMEFLDQPTLVHVEIRSASGFLEEPAEISRAKVAWRGLRSMALSPEDSVRLIAEIAGELT